MAEENMGPTNHDERLEAMLDSMLRAYSDAQPRPRLETRVLAALRSQETPRNPIGWTSWRLWSIGGVAAAAALLFAVWLWQAAPLPAAPAAAFKAPPPPARTTPSPETHVVRRHGGTRIAASENPVAPADVRQEVFPSPTPLSEQEQALLRYLRGTPKEEIIAQSRPDLPPPPDDGETLQPQSQQFRKSESYNTR